MDDYTHKGREGLDGSRDLLLFTWSSLTYQAKGFSIPHYQQHFLVVLQKTCAGTAGWLSGKTGALRSQGYSPGQAQAVLEDWSY